MGAPVVHFEIGVNSSEKSAAFFSQLFGWTATPMGPAMMINTGAAAGIQGHITALGHAPHNYVTVYAQVDDVQATLDKTAKLGGKTLVPPTLIPGRGTFAWLGDLDGNVIGLWKPV